MESQGLFDFITDSAVLLDKAGRILAWNAGATAMFGYSRKEVLGRSISLIYDRNYHFSKLIQEASPNHHHKHWQEETTFIRKNGMKGQCKSTLTCLPANEQNKITALLIHQNTTAYKNTVDELQTAQDNLLKQFQQLQQHYVNANRLILDNLHNLEQTERKLRESELRFHLLAANATDVISRHTPDGNYLYASPACTDSMGYKPEQLMGQPVYKYIHHDDQKKLKKAFTRRRDAANNRSIIYRLRKRDGEFRWFESNIRLIIDDQTHLINEIQLASRDVTDRILDKKARLRGQQLAHVFRLSTMEEMASGMAHEISQPLAAIINYTRGCARYLEKNSHDPDQLRNVMQKAVAQAERAGEIVQRLKNFFCKGQLVKTPCKINNVIRETSSLLKNELQLSKTKLDFDFDRDLPFIFIDKIQLQQVLLNLIQNAIEAMHENAPQDKRIHIHTVATPSNNIDITIRDTGPGFSREIINNVFTPFFTTKAHGRGMGLAICRSIIEAHGGQFTIQPNTHSKSWIRFTLPISI